MIEFPKVVYHEDGKQAVVASAEEHTALGKGWGMKPNDNTHRALRKASGAAKTDQLAPMVMPQTEVY